MSTIETDLAYAAGMISFAGSFVLVPAGGKNDDKVVRYVLRSVNRLDAVTELARIMGVDTTITTSNGKQATQVTLQGTVLHHFMTKVWPYLPRDRKQDYARSRAKRERSTARGNIRQTKREDRMDRE